MASTITCDVLIVGAGLAGGLIALALAARHPALDVRLIDGGDSVGGNHLWSFFGADVAAADRWIVDPLVEHRWPGYDVAFPAHRRRIGEAYHSVASATLDAQVRRVLPAGALMLGRTVAAVTPTAAELVDGDRVKATGVIDARGMGDLTHLDLGWQKFVGCELTLDRPHGIAEPTVMDGTVAQIDGYRFVYCLPLAPTRMFVEDTYYSSSAALDRAVLGPRIDDYARARGWQVAARGREEAGVLPVAMGGDFEAYWRSGDEADASGVAKVGMRAGLFHPMTGYSLPDAVRTAAMLANARDFSGPALHEATHALAAESWQARGFYRMLARMLFRAAEPAMRYRVLERFYRLDARLISRFYAGHSTMSDKARILAGKPPVPITRAIRAIAGFPQGATA
jgi:lycopene beta-cyclase